MQTYKPTIKHFFISGLLGLWCLLTNAVFAGETPQGLSDNQWQGIQQHIQQDLRKSAAVHSPQVKAFESQKLTASDGAAYDHFGEAVSLNGNRLAIGADIADVGGNNNQGAVYLFDFNGSSWSESQKLTASDGAAYNNFGFAISLDGNRLAIGAGWAEVGGNTDQGAVYIFDFNGSSWVQRQKLIASDGAAYDIFGFVVSLDGNRLAIGACKADIGGNKNQGAVYIFDFNGSSWSESQKLTAGDGAIDDWFGNTVSLDGSRLAVGALLADIGGNIKQGAVYIFDFNGSSWSESQKLTAGDSAAYDRFGRAVSLDGNHLVVGAYGADIGGNNNQGAVYIFDFNGSSWSESQKLTASDGALEDRLGRVVSLDGNHLAVGAYGADIGGNPNQGAVYVFNLPATTSAAQAIPSLGSTALALLVLLLAAVAVWLMQRRYRTAA